MTDKQLAQAFPVYNIRVIGQMTVVDCYGRVLQHGTQGVVIVDCEDHRPVLAVTEVSDDEIIHLFINTASGASELVPSEEPDNGYEVLMNR